MNKYAIAKEMSSRSKENNHVASMTIQDAKESLDLFVEILTDALKKGEKVSIQGFGTFSTKYVDAHTGRNPRTGEDVDVSAKYIPRCKFSPSLKDELKDVVRISDSE